MNLVNSCRPLLVILIVNTIVFSLMLDKNLKEGDKMESRVDMQVVFQASPYPDVLGNEIVYQGISKLPVKSRIQVGYKYRNRLDKVADDVYGDVNYWWAIALYNNIKNPMDFENTELALFEKQDLLNLIDSSRIKS